jgi:hypothetical protein
LGKGEAVERNLHVEEGQCGLWSGLGIEPGDELREHGVEGMGF